MHTDNVNVGSDDVNSKISQHSCAEDKDILPNKKIQEISKENYSALMLAAFLFPWSNIRYQPIKTTTQKQKGAKKQENVKMKIQLFIILFYIQCLDYRLNWNNKLWYILMDFN